MFPHHHLLNVRLLWLRLLNPSWRTWRGWKNRWNAMRGWSYKVFMVSLTSNLRDWRRFLVQSLGQGRNWVWLRISLGRRTSRRFSPPSTTLSFWRCSVSCHHLVMSSTQHVLTRFHLTVETFKDLADIISYRRGIRSKTRTGFKLRSIKHQGAKSPFHNVRGKHFDLGFRNGNGGKGKCFRSQNKMCQNPKQNVSESQAFCFSLELAPMYRSRTMPIWGKKRRGGRRCAVLLIDRSQVRIRPLSLRTDQLHWSATSGAPLHRVHDKVQGHVPAGHRLLWKVSRLVLVWEFWQDCSCLGDRIQAHAIYICSCWGGGAGERDCGDESADAAVTMLFAAVGVEVLGSEAAEQTLDWLHLPPCGHLQQSCGTAPYN